VKFLRVLLAATLILAVVLMEFPLTVAAGPVRPTVVRIGLVFDDNASHSGASQVTVSGPGGVELGIRNGSTFTLLKTLGANESAKLTTCNGQLLLNTTQQVTGGTLTARPVGTGQAIRVSEKGTSYRGMIEVATINGELRVVNEVGIEDYLYGVVPKEMSDYWPLEALKAQAVAARTYVAANLGRYGNYGFDLTDDTYCQAYGGVNVEGSNSRAAVTQTCGEILVYNGQPISALYHSNSGGYTENSENVWMSAIPYLKGVNDPYSVGLGGNSDKWQKSFSKESLENSINKKLKASGRSTIGSLSGIRVLETGVSGRLTKVSIDGTAGSAVISKDLIRYYLGDLDSNLFTITPDNQVMVIGLGQAQQTSLSGKYVVSGNDTVSQLPGGTLNVQGDSSSRQIPGQPSNYLINGRGWGHGVGMSQWGAYGMAIAGKGYQEILTFYYQGTQIFK
jgi:stage II sporulation protein D